MDEGELATLRVRRLLAEARSDRAVMMRRSAEITRFAAANPNAPPEQPGALAVALDRTYTTLEALLERVARTLEGGIPDAAEWHSALLRNAALDMPGIRPAVLGAEALAAADELRRFRHFLRHAYSADLNLARLRELAHAWEAALPAMALDLDGFERFLEATITALAPPQGR